MHTLPFPYGISAKSSEVKMQISGREKKGGKIWSKKMEVRGKMKDKRYFKEGNICKN
jgi:hypothetical protein